MGNGDGIIADGTPLVSHDRPDSCIVVYNTFINNHVQYGMAGRPNGYGATNITVANNIFQGHGNMAGLSNSSIYNGTWFGNIRWDDSNPGSMPASGYTTVNPLLAPDSDGIYHIQKGSPAIGMGVGYFPMVTVDIDGQPRGASKDVGADQFSPAPILSRPLTPNDVGPGSANANGSSQNTTTPQKSSATKFYLNLYVLALSISLGL